MKKVIVLSAFFMGYFANAQNIGNSPYAIYGIGDRKYENAVDISGMGGISTAFVNDFNNRFNFQNPAGNQNFGMTSFTLEGTNENNYFSSNNQSSKSEKHSTYLSNISFSFPISKRVKFGVNYQPYSSKSYEFLNASDSFASRFQGSGALSSLQGALSYHINSHFSLGIKTNYIFGKLTDLEEVTSKNVNLINGYETNTKVKNFNFTGGFVFQHKFKNDKKITLGATYTFGGNGEANTDYKNSTYYYLDEETKENETLIDYKKTISKNLIPEEFSVGVGYGKDAKWYASTQFDYRRGQEIQFLGKPFPYQDAYKVSMGGWWLPNYNNFRNYFSRVIYRFGAYYEKGGLSLNPVGGIAKSINEFAVTAGASFPFENSNINKMSSLDIAIEVGKRGTTQNNLINQSFFNLKVGLNFSDLWFRKVEFD